MLQVMRIVRRAVTGAVAFAAIATVVAQSNAPVANPVTDVECEGFGRQLERHFAAGDKGFYARAFDSDKVFERLPASQAGATGELEAHRADFKKQFNDFLLARMNQVGSMKFLRLKR